MKIRTTKIGGIRYIFVSGPQEFVTFAVATIKEANTDERITLRTDKLGYCDIRGCNIFRSAITCEPWENLEISALEIACPA